MPECRLYSFKSTLDSSEYFHNVAHILLTTVSKSLLRKLTSSKWTTCGVGRSEENERWYQFLDEETRLLFTTVLVHSLDKSTVNVAKADGTSEQITGKNIIIKHMGSKTNSFALFLLIKQESLLQQKLRTRKKFQTLSCNWCRSNRAELGSVYARLGAKVSFVEFADSMIPTMDKRWVKNYKSHQKIRC